MWNSDDFSGLKRIWIQPDSIETIRTYISIDSIPVSNRVALDSLHQEWEEHYTYLSYPGLPFMVEMKAINPDSLKQFIIEYGEFLVDSIADPSSINFTLAKRFRGTVRGRLTHDYTNDLDDVVNKRIPLSGIHVILKCNNLVRIGRSDIYTNDNGEFEVDYDVVSFFDRDEIELQLEFVTESKFGTKVKKKGSLFENNPYVEIVELGSKEDATLTELNVEFNGERSYPFRTASWAYLAFRFLEENAPDFMPTWDLKIKLHYLDADHGSHYRPVQRNIYLEDGDERHETIIWHEYGHFFMNFLTGNTNKGGGGHSSVNESNFQTAWSEGWATGFMSFLDIYYRELDNESGTYGFFERGVDPSGSSRGRMPIEQRDPIWFTGTNGIRSEYLISCTLHDLFDGPNHIKNISEYNDGTVPNGYDGGEIDDLELDINDIIVAMANNPISVTDFYIYLCNNSNCDDREKIFKVFDQNRVRFNGRRLSPDEIGFIESFDDFLTFDPDIWDWINPNLVTLETRLIRDVQIEGSEDFSFNLAPINTLDGHKHIGHDVNVTNDGILFINQNSSYGWLNGNSNGEEDGTPYANSNVLVEVCNSIINVRFGGNLIIGDANGTNTATMAFNNGSTLSTNFNNWSTTSKIIVNNNSKLVIEVGAILEYYPGTEIVLNGPNAVLEIKGQIQIMNGATFSVSGGTSGLGYIKFYRDKNSGLPPLINSPTDDGSVQLIGSGSNSKLIEIDGTEGLFIDKIIIDNKLSYIVDFSIKQAKVVLGDKSRIEPIVSGKVFFEEVDINQLYNGYKHDGLLINGVQNEFHLVRINGGNYGFTNTGLLYGDEKLYLRAVQITDCAVGIMTYSSGITYHGGFVKGYSIAGWKSVGANVPSDVTGVMFNNDQNNSEVYGVLLDGVNAAGDVTFTGSTFQNNLSGIQFWSVPANLKSCNYFANNYIGAQMEAWSKLDMSNNSYTTFDGNTTHFVSRYNGIVHMYGGRNGFLQSGNSTLFFASLEPGAQSPSVVYVSTPPGPLDYNAHDNFFQMNLIQAPASGNNFWLDERNSRVLYLNTNSTYPSNNPGVWNTAQSTACGTPDYETLEFNGTGGGVGQFLVGKYSTLNAITIPNGLEYGNNLISVSKGLLDSLYLSSNPNYAQITCKLGHLARYTYSNNSQTMKDFKIEMLDNALKSYALGVSKNKILTRKDTMVYASNCLINTIDTLLIDANNDSLPWKNYKFGLSTMKSEVLRIAKHRAEAVSHLQSLLTTYSDSLEQVYITKWKCVNEAEIALIDSQVSLDSLYIVYPCYGSAIEFNAPMPYSLDVNKNNSKLDNLENAISLFPNPSKDYLEIKLSNNQPIKKATIYDLRGVEILSIDNLTDASELNINIENISSGTYIIQVLTDDFVYNKRLVISK